MCHNAWFELQKLNRVCMVLGYESYHKWVDLLLVNQIKGAVNKLRLQENGVAHWSAIVMTPLRKINKPRNDLRCLKANETFI